MNSKIPVLTQAISAQSLEEFLAEMDKGAKTLKWDALLVFDRSATNALLTQEYIDRVDIEDVFFPALPDGSVDVGNGIEHVLLGLILDKPRLSFENASIQDSKGKLQMRLVGGKHIEVSEKFLDGKPVRRVGALTVYNAATRGLLDMNIRLEAVAGSVDSSGKVLLDLNDAFDHQFSGGGTEFEKQRLGLYFQNVFDAWNEKNERITQFPLSEMVVDEGSPINPGVFGLLTHAAPGATVLGSEGYGDGAVVVFVAMKGSAAGTYPHDDAAMLYMLPEAPEPYTSNLVFSNKFLANQIFKLGFEQLEMTKGRFDVEALAGERFKLVANSEVVANETVSLAKKRSGGMGSEYWETHLKLDNLSPVLFSSGNELLFEQRSLKGTLVSSARIGSVAATWTGKWGSGSDSFGVYADVKADVGFKFVIRKVDGQAKLVFELEQFDLSAEFTIDIGSGSDKDRWRDMAREIEAELEGILHPRYQARFDDFKNITFEIDALRLNNLLFRGDNVVEPRDVAMPTDLTLLGNLAPKRTTLVISPQEPIVASGQVIEFTADGTTGGVTWKVENLPGETGETGVFNDPSTGRYTAPSDDALRAEGYRRLIVTATSGELVSRALVSVVPSQVTVNPWVAVVNVGQSYSLSAGTPDSAALRWDDPELGNVGPDNDPLNPEGYKYTAPVRLPTPAPLDPLHAGALRLDPVTVRPAAGGAAATIDMLVVGAKNPNYWLEPEARSGGSVALPFYRLNRNFEKVEVPEPVEWTVLRGSGTVDQDTRVYTPAPDADEQYVIISAFFDDGVSPDTLDYVVLPLPFIPVRRYADILNQAIKEV
ncbi:TPA: hypothetical protein U8203_004906 [Pseudomonas putida]|nr:hypothetical protein [Pseudomonas putida]HEN8719534.1 hypothetical protein [Pseudomonas putida]